MAPWVSPGYMPQDVLLEPTISLMTSPSELGRPWPPYAGSAASPCQPPSTYWAKACLKPAGVVTSPLLKWQPSSSPLRLSGDSTFSQNLAPSSRIASIMSGLASVAPRAA
ncbi:hypothetical protein D3C76_1508510 [compost metagenome]